ncbi:hypothetical protein Salat_0871900 [Sesamum alatum]|uniref:Uncharacterized protein n=1 Tax=Sesamum alatum TaxID=300844 RepID=A0AAE1YIV4_9LAMI|nr:hypothetical protein Salat_0871900 [Sesamum alatum]
MNEKHGMVGWLRSLTSNILTWVQIPADAISSPWPRLDLVPGPRPGPPHASSRGAPLPRSGADHPTRGRCLEPGGSPALPGARGTTSSTSPRTTHALEAGASSWGGSPALPGARSSTSSTSSRTAQLEEMPRAGQLTSDRLELGSASAQGDSSWGGPRRTTPARGASSWALFWLGGLTTLS